MRCRTMLLAASALAAWGVVAEARAGDAVEEIVVTAQKRAERLQDVPISITAVSGEDLSRRGATSLIDLVFSVPGVSALEYGPGQERVQMRGISNSLGLPTVGRYLDEMPINMDAQGLGLDLRLLDMERIEVLRGPQGTLYGEGSMGGTIRYITASPNLSRYGADIDAQVGTVADGGTGGRASAALNLPLVEDRLGVRLVAGYEKQAGWIDSAVTGAKDVNDVEIRTVRGKLLARPGDKVEISLLVLHQGNDQGAQNFGIDRRSSALVPEYSNQRYDLVNAVLRWDLGFADLVNSFGWARQTVSSQYDLSAYYVPLLTAPPPFGLGLPVGFISRVGLQSGGENRVFTDELRLSSKPGGAVDWTLGLYGRDFRNLAQSDAIVGPGSLGVGLISGGGTVSSKSWSAFGEVGWHATDRLTVAAGARWFSDRRATNSVASNFGFSSSDSNGATFTSFNPRVNVAYAFSPDTLVYLNAAKGFRSGGFNAAASGGGFPVPLTYAPETLWTYELGAKQQWFQRRLAVEAAVYHNDWKNVQSTFFAPGSTAAVVMNGGKVRGSGVDLSLTGRPVDGLTLTASYGWNDMAYKTATLDKQVGDPVDVAVRESWSASIDWRRPLFGDTKGFARFDYQHAGPAQITSRNLGNTVIPIAARDLFNARFGLDFGRFEASIFADNLADDRTPLIPGPYGVIGQNVEQRPRTVGVDVKARF